ncbi:DUF3575 domain-containing protein [Mesonia mobilis]|uniref:Outer membrane protein beta-barrel domain-containing protein n=1 Tax=Mesonia mobilis TaxID=369791 RepID=A0ABQ3BFY9_9FLAO|nr:DUF3575 domain-containing protein [Mesonia mobilis]MBQ0736890.1 hypothetical protein [Aquimarina celericrescens]GGZ43355.1 hypothetical protein GCM10008088_00330 [Mesonia mobilis]
MKWFLIVFFCVIGFGIQAQESQQASVEKEVYGVQVGLGFWAHYELGLSNTIALRGELGFNPYITEPGFIINEKTHFGFMPIVRVEPRWYFNLKKRLREDRNISKNSGNFLSLNVAFTPNSFTIFDNSDYDVETINQLSVIPTWGMRRTYWEHFTLETGAGLGYVRSFQSDDYYLNPDKEHLVGLKIYFRLGYTF